MSTIEMLRKFTLNIFNLKKLAVGIKIFLRVNTYHNTYIVIFENFEHNLPKIFSEDWNWRNLLWVREILVYLPPDSRAMISGRCAACRYLRRRCPSDCIFAPYFPPNNPQRFASVHRIYGASNVARMLQVTYTY